MAKYTKKDIIQMVEDDDVEFIRLQFTDIFGALKNVAITASQIEKVLDNGCMFGRVLRSKALPESKNPICIWYLT